MNKQTIQTKLVQAASMILSTLLLAACAAPQQPVNQQPVKKDMANEAPAPVDQILAVQYRCENKRLLQVVYDNRDPELSRVRLSTGAPNQDGTWVEQDSISMHQVRSGSGALYVADQRSLQAQWHSKGDEGLWIMRIKGRETVIRCVAIF